MTKTTAAVHLDSLSNPQHAAICNLYAGRSCDGRSANALVRKGLAIKDEQGVRLSNLGIEVMDIYSASITAEAAAAKADAKVPEANVVTLKAKGVKVKHGDVVKRGRAIYRVLKVEVGRKNPRMELVHFPETLEHSCRCGAAAKGANDLVEVFGTRETFAGMRRLQSHCRGCRAASAARAAKKSRAAAKAAKAKATK